MLKGYYSSIKKTRRRKRAVSPDTVSRREETELVYPIKYDGDTIATA